MESPVNYELPAIQTIDDITNAEIRAEIQKYIDLDYVLGFMLWGSRATRFAEPTTDYDALIYVTQEFFDKLPKKDIAILTYDETVTPKRMVIDFTYWADSIFEDQLKSPMDIDHAAYVEGIVLNDKTGKLEEWWKKLAQYPIKKHEDRVKSKFINLGVSFGYAVINQRRDHQVDMMLNLQKSIVLATNLLFALQKKWAPPMKWWSKYVKVYGIDKKTYDIFEQAILNLNVDTMRAVYLHLKELIKSQGINLDNAAEDFFDTIYPEGRKKLCEHSYI